MFVCYTAVMLLAELSMRKTGGPGIIPFDLAGSVVRAEEIMTSWGGTGQRCVGHRLSGERRLADVSRRDPASVGLGNGRIRGRW